MDILKQRVNVDRIKEFHTERTEDDLDLVQSVYNLIKMKIDQITADIFYNDPDVQSVKDKKPNVQVVVLSKYFNNLLLRYRAHNGYNVTNELHALGVTQDPIDWLSIFARHVLAFIDTVKVYQTLIKE